MVWFGVVMLNEKYSGKKIKIFKKDHFLKWGTFVGSDDKFVFIKTSNGVEGIAKDEIERIVLVDNDE